MFKTLKGIVESFVEGFVEEINEEKKAVEVSQEIKIPVWIESSHSEEEVVLPSWLNK